MRTGDIETYFANGRWYNRRHGTPGPFFTGTTKAEVQLEGRRAAITEKASHIVRSEDGRIIGCDRYGNTAANVTD